MRRNALRDCALLATLAHRAYNRREEKRFVFEGEGVFEGKTMMYPVLSRAKHLVLLVVLFSVACSETPIVVPTGPRTNYEITKTFESHKSSFISLHQRALRRNPSAQGKVVTEIQIAPSGAVTSCRVLSSEIDDPLFLEGLVKKIRTMNFGAKRVESITITYPLEFFKFR